MPIENAAPSTRRAPRFDMFGTSHKMLRFVLADATMKLATTSFDDPRAAAEAVAQLEQTLQMCDRHLAYEDAIVFPALIARLAGAIASIEAEHQCQPRLAAELRALAAGVLDASADRRELAGRTLYLHFTRFVAALFAHMAEEEQVVQPLFERHFSDAELVELHARVIASLEPAELARAATWILRATNEKERTAIKGLLAERGL